MSAVWIETTSGALVRGDTVVWISKAATSLSVQQQGGDAHNTVADWGAGHPDLPTGFGQELAVLLTQLARQRDPHVLRAVVVEHGWRWQIERIEPRHPSDDADPERAELGERAEPEEQAEVGERAGREAVGGQQA